MGCLSSDLCGHCTSGKSGPGRFPFASMGPSWGRPVTSLSWGCDLPWSPGLLFWVCFPALISGTFTATQAGSWGARLWNAQAWGTGYLFAHQPASHVDFLLYRLRRLWLLWPWQIRSEMAPLYQALMACPRHGVVGQPAQQPWSPQPQAPRLEVPQAHRLQPLSLLGMYSWGPLCSRVDGALCLGTEPLRDLGS
jgi:hypothetical protein